MGELGTGVPDCINNNARLRHEVRAKVCGHKEQETNKEPVKHEGWHCHNVHLDRDSLSQNGYGYLIIGFWVFGFGSIRWVSLLLPATSESNSHIQLSLCRKFSVVVEVTHLPSGK